MSLEQKIEELTAAIVSLTLRMGGANIGKAEVEPETTLSEVVKAIKEVKADEIETVEVKEVKKPTPDATTPKSPKASEITYEDVKKNILAISSKSRDSAVELLASFGAASGPKLKEEQYAKFVTAAEAVLAKLNSDE